MAFFISGEPADSQQRREVFHRRSQLLHRPDDQSYYKVWILRFLNLFWDCWFNLFISCALSPERWWGPTDGNTPALPATNLEARWLFFEFGVVPELKMFFAFSPVFSFPHSSCLLYVLPVLASFSSVILHVWLSQIFLHCFFFCLICFWYFMSLKVWT